MSTSTSGETFTCSLIVTHIRSQSLEVTVTVPDEATIPDIVNHAVAEAMESSKRWRMVRDTWCGNIICDDYILDPEDADLRVVRKILRRRKEARK